MSIPVLTISHLFLSLICKILMFTKVRTHCLFSCIFVILQGTIEIFIFTEINMQYGFQVSFYIFANILTIYFSFFLCFLLVKAEFSF